MSLFSVVFLLTAPAHALDCAGPGEYTVLPANGTLDAPANTLLWVGEDQLHDDERLSLEGVDMYIEPVIAGAIETEEGTLVVYDPGELPVGTSWDLIVDGGAAGRRVLTQFTIDAPVDTTPPDVPVAWLEETIEYDDWGFTGVVWAWEAHGGLTVVDLDGTAALDEHTPNGSVQEVAAYDSVRMGTGDGCTDSWPQAHPGSSGEFTFAAYDLAGNFSGWGAEESTEIGDPEDWECGTHHSCSSAGPHGASGVALTMGAMLLGARRRR